MRGIWNAHAINEDTPIRSRAQIPRAEKHEHVTARGGWRGGRGLASSHESIDSLGGVGGQLAFSRLIRLFNWTRNHSDNDVEGRSFNLAPEIPRS